MISNEVADKTFDDYFRDIHASKTIEGIDAALIGLDDSCIDDLAKVSLGIYADRRFKEIICADIVRDIIRECIKAG